MLAAPEHPDEPARLKALHALNLLDTAPDENYDRLTRLAQRLFRVPIVLVTLVDADRQWFKSRQGLDTQQTPRCISLCGHAIQGDELFVVNDALADERFADNPLVLGEPKLRFYAGRTLRTVDGAAVGTLCLIDHLPRELDAADRLALNDLGQLVENELAATQLALEDMLTRIPNRRGFERLALHALSMCQREKLPATLVYFDLDRFKSINDLHGHAAGDLALQAFARLLTQTYRSSDVCGRLGGDEFGVLQTGSDGQRSPIALQRLQAGIDRFNAQHVRSERLAFSAGEATIELPSPQDLPALLAQADRQMYRQKLSRAAAGSAVAR